MSDTIKTKRLEGAHLVIETSQGSATYDSRFLVAALLIYVARGSGTIEPEESAQMIELIEDYFHMQGAESLELITYAMSELAEHPSLETLLGDLGKTLSDGDKEDIAFMGLKVVAADGRKDFAELEQFKRAMDGAGISSEIVHRAFDRYFAETMTGKYNK